MKLNAVFFAFVLGLLSLAQAADTLEVFVLLVDFKQEKPDNSLTTGDGRFNSDTKVNYKLDPSGVRANPNYWLRHFEFVNAFYQAASGGKLAVRARVFPENSLYTLDKPIMGYNRTGKSKGEKTAEYDEDRSRLYLNFIYDAVAKAHSSSESPFKVPLSKNPNVKRSYMIAHAGASRLLDGGSMGTRNADTPGDFLDIYVDKDAWMYLMPDSAKVKSVQPVMGVGENGDTVTTALTLKDAVTDTLRSIMVVSETASQDGLNWGINGIIANQVGRELGLPNTYDVVKGISRLGYFDLMDFAGYNAGNGFLPALPGAWDRLYMGWGTVKEVRPTAGHPITVEIAAAGSGLGTEIVKVPLNGSEYLLIENRQRSWNKDGTVEVGYVKDAGEQTEEKKITVPVDSVSKLFEDSVCVKGKCKPNEKQLSGFILAPSSFDAGLPASGIAVWKVNEWYLRETLQYGIANFWGGKALRDHQFGISLIESDGILSIGKSFKNALGEDTYDYGSGTDLLPHLRIPAKDSKQKFDTVKTIAPTGYANTMTTQGGYTGIKITVNVPKDARKEKTSNAFMGDSVVNYAAPIISVTISIDDGSIEGSKFPREIGLNSAVRGAVFIDDPEHEGEKIIVVGAEDGTLQAFNALGDTLFVADTVITQKSLTRDSAKVEVPLYRVGPSNGALVGMASDGKNVYSLHRNKLVKTRFFGGIPIQDELAVDSATAGPVIHDGKIWIASREGVVMYDAVKFEKKSTINVHESNSSASKIYTDMAYCRQDAGKGIEGVQVSNDGELFTTQGWIKLNGKSGETFRIACTDMDRNDKVDIIAVGSRGTVAAVNYDESKKSLVTRWTKSYKRGAAGTSGLKNETSGIAIGDINGDKYPEIVFLGDNLVYALDRSGLPIAGFPIKVSRGTPIYGFFSDPVLVDVTGDATPEILVPSNDGLVYAYTGKGKALAEKDGFPLAAGSFEYAESEKQLKPMSIFVADAVPTAKSAGPELYALHRNKLSAFRLRKASADAAESPAAWTLPVGGNERTGFFDASKLGAPESSKQKDEISEFFVYPNPVRGGNAKARFEIGNSAKTVSLEIYDITGYCVYQQKMSGVQAGRNQFENLDLKALGSDVYTVRLQVKFSSGKTKQKLYRIGVVR
ncbi:MAG: hypothetical protein IJ909_00555 [Fibrobacter sp.]|nr:hypothetical protein [Fibrobacter sp.]